MVWGLRRKTKRTGGSFALALIACVCLGAPLAVAKESRNCTARERAAADKLLTLSKANQAQFLKRHLPWGGPEPTAATETVLVHRDYVIAYDRELRVPIWTAHRLGKRGLSRSERVNCFRPDPRLSEPGVSTPTDYKEPLFDQGHLTPNSDMSRALMPVINSFIMSNMTPQYCHFNRGVWQIFESIVRLWVKEHNTIYVITGSVFDRNSDGKRDANSAVPRMKSNNNKTRVAVPSHQYKIIARQDKDGTFHSLAVLVRNDKTDLDGDAAIEYLSKNVRSISEIELRTGLRFFPKFERDAAVMKNARIEFWAYKGKPARTLVNASCRKTTDLPEPI
jgi:endonuclease G, mitochondrial